MSVATLVLAAVGALDVAAARRLADYGPLDDAGVARALEQVHMQRWGRADLPAHLRRLADWSAVIVVAGRVRWVDAPAGRSEAESLARLFSQDIGRQCELVDWDGTARDWLLARASAMQQVAPAWLVQGTPCALQQAIAPVAADHPADPAQVEAECRHLFDPAWHLAPEAAPGVRHIAGSRARLWWRSAIARGALASATGDRWVKQLAANDANG